MRKRLKQSLCLLLCALTVAVSAQAARLITPTRTYPAGKFADVPASAWYAENVAASYEMELIDGKSDTRFAPDDQLTLAETIKLAACLHAMYETGETDFPSSTPWYQVYVDYALSQGLITQAPANPDAAATRAQFVQILSKALPQQELAAINTIADGAIPDVAMSQSYAAPVYLFYRAGILTGSDETGRFLPDTTIARSEVAAILTRMADTDLRRTFTLGGNETPEPDEGDYPDAPGIPDFAPFSSQPVATRNEDGYYIYDYSGNTAAINRDFQNYWAYLAQDGGFIPYDMRNYYYRARSAKNPALMVTFFSTGDSIYLLPQTDYSAPSYPGRLDYYPETDDANIVPDYGALFSCEPLFEPTVNETESGSYVISYAYAADKQTYEIYLDQLFRSGFFCYSPEKIDTATGCYFLRSAGANTYYPIGVFLHESYGYIIVTYYTSVGTL